MTAALTQVPYYFAIDCAEDISADELQLSLDRTYGVTATYVPSPPDEVTSTALASQPVAAGYVRYWWSAMAGPGEDLPLRYGGQQIHGKLTDNDNVIYLAWRVSVPTD